MKINSKDLNTLRYWAQVGIGLKAHEYEEKYPEREDPHNKVARIVHKVYETQDANVRCTECGSVFLRGCRCSNKKHIGLVSVN